MNETILVVDDEQLVRDMLARRLESRGFNCLTADAGHRALELISGDSISLVLLDISMPDMSGLDVLNRIKVSHPDTMVIMVTAVVDINTAIKAMTSGAYDYLIKPIETEILYISVTRALERRNLTMENKEYQQKLEQKVWEQTREIQKSVINTVTALANALEAKDKYTRGHSERVTDIAIKIARHLALTDSDIDKIRLAGLLHDIGKIGVREDILDKPGKLTDEEFEQVKTHSKVGEHILRPVIKDKDILDMVIHHHERYDGNGYPDGLADGEISLNASILAVADAYDAMTSGRPYRKALKIEEARAELARFREKQFHPVVVDALFGILDEGITL
jgi:putative two-component system response regulator